MLKNNDAAMLGIRFGNLPVTIESIPPGLGEPQLPEPVADSFVIAASNGFVVVSQIAFVPWAASGVALVSTIPIN